MPSQELNARSEPDWHSKLASRFESALRDILKVAKTSTIPDRHGEWHDACDTTCLNDVKRVAEKALSILED